MTSRASYEACGLKHLEEFKQMSTYGRASYEACGLKHLESIKDGGF